MKTLAIIFGLTVSGVAVGSDYPALDLLQETQFYTSAQWFNCGVRPDGNTSTGELKLKVVSIRGSGSCTSDGQLSTYTCDKYMNRCRGQDGEIRVCRNGDFMLAGSRQYQRYYTSGYHGDCVLADDYLVDQLQFVFLDEDGGPTDALLPGHTYGVTVAARNQTRVTLGEMAGTVTLEPTAGVTLDDGQLTFPSAAPGTTVAGTGASLTIDANVACGTGFYLKAQVSLGERRRVFEKRIPIGKAVRHPIVVSAPGTPLQLVADGTTNLTIPAVGDAFPYRAKVFSATVRGSFTHEMLGEITAVKLGAPGAAPVQVLRGDGYHPGTQWFDIDVTRAFADKSGWGDWTLAITEQEWRQKGTLQSFQLELVPAVFSCQ